jgi:hypothetical protein
MLYFDQNSKSLMSVVPVYKQLVTIKLRLEKATIRVFTVEQLFLLAAGGEVCLHAGGANLHHRTNTESFLLIYDINNGLLFLNRKQYIRYCELNSLLCLLSRIESGVTRPVLWQ